MSKIALVSNASGTGTLSLVAPNTNSDRTIDLPDAAGTVFVSGQAVTATTGNFSGNVTLGSSVLETPSGAAPAYLCRAWVNFNGTGTVAIRASGNVSSITDNGTGDYRVNFTTAMPDTNYAAVFGNAWSSVRDSGTNGAATTYLDVVTGFTSNTSGGGTGADASAVQIAIFR